MFAVFRTRRFEKEMEKRLSKEEQKKVVGIERDQLTVHPFVGDPLGYPFFREKKIGGKRIYFLIYEDLRSVLMVAISDKKTQQETIDEIKGSLESYFGVVKEAVKRHGGYGPVSRPQGSRQADP